MRFAAVVAYLLLGCICTILSQGTKDRCDLPSLGSPPLGDIEVAYYIISEGKFVFYIPNRLLHPGLIQTCLLLLQNQRDIVCAYDTPNKPFEVFGSFTGTIAVSWHMKCAINGTTGGFSFAREEIVYSILGIDTRPKFPLRVDLISPAFGTIMANNLSIAYDVNGNYVPQMIIVMDTSYVNFKVEGILEGHSAPVNSKEITGRSDIEPGSWFFSLTPIIDSRIKENGSIERLDGYPNLGYIEFVLSRESIDKNRRFSVAWKEISNQNHIIKPPQKRASEDESSKTVDQTRLCIWGTFKMDGQKNIFLKQLQYLDRTRFAFTWVAAEWPAEVAKGNGSEEYKQHADLRSRLSTMSHVKVVFSPYATHAIDVKQVDEHAEGGDVPLSSAFQKNESLMHEYISSRFRLSNGDIDSISPPWVKTLYTLMRTHFRNEMCDIVVYGNSRGLSSNMLITDTARALGIPTVSELLNLFINPGTIPRAVVGPSMYSVEHERESLSKTKIMMTDADVTHRRKQCAKETDEVMTVIIPPSVDTNRFDPDKIEEKDIVYHPHCIGRMMPTEHCFTIGFVARLSAEKNPGMFLLSAEKILQHNPFIRFTMVGDGDLRPYLENLASRLGILWAVHFTGWLSAEDLPRVLRGFTVLVNPSLRAWSETFCIANIEAMSMRVPLVTFAVGGIPIRILATLTDFNCTALISLMCTLSPFNSLQFTVFISLRYNVLIAPCYVS